MIMKPSLLNTGMVRAILDGRKTVTRRAVKDKDITNAWDCEADGTPIAYIDQLTGDHYPPTAPCYYQSGDLLYVRETFFERKGKYHYKADGNHLALNALVGGKEFFKWRPSIHMPKEAARIFLRVTDVFAQRIQDITDEQARAEGCKDRDDFACVWNECYASPQPVKKNGVIIRYESYPWEDTQETRIYRGIPWIVIGNPWVWVIEFVRISREEALR